MPSVEASYAISVTVVVVATPTSLTSTFKPANLLFSVNDRHLKEMSGGVLAFAAL